MRAIRSDWSIKARAATSAIAWLLLGYVWTEPVARTRVLAEEKAALVSKPSPRLETRISLVATGDVLIHSPVASAAARNAANSGHAFDFRPMFAPVRRFIKSADLALCHLETPLTRETRDLSPYPRFNAPHELASALRWTGYDVCSTASNHAIDQGLTGVRETLDALDQARVRHAGTARDVHEARRPTIVTVEGIKVAHLSYTYGLNGLVLPTEQPWAVNLIAPRHIIKAAQRARQAGADFVVVSLHWGTEYEHAPTETQRTIAKRLLAAPPIDLIVGHHAHVTQPVARLGRRYVFYGLGNFLSAQSSACCAAATQDGVIVKLTLTRSGRDVRVTEIEYVPTWVEPVTYRILPVASLLEDRGLAPDQRASLLQSWYRTVIALADMPVEALPDGAIARLPRSKVRLLSR